MTPWGLVALSGQARHGTLINFKSGFPLTYYTNLPYLDFAVCCQEVGIRSCMLQDPRISAFTTSLSIWEKSWSFLFLTLTLPMNPIFLKAVVSLNAEDRGVSKAGKLWFCSCLILLGSWGREKRKYKEAKQLISLNIVFQRQSYSDIK